MAAEPPTAEKVLADNHAKADEDGIGDADKPIALQSVAVEDETTYDRLQQVVREAHTTKHTQMFKRLANTLECIPSRDDGRDNH